jgi:hypothetical protein
VPLNDIGSSRKMETMCKLTQEVGSQNAKDNFECGQSMNLGELRLKIKRGTNRRRKLRNLLAGKGPNSGLTSGISTMTMPLLIIYKIFKFLAKNQLQKWTIHPIHLT